MSSPKSTKSVEPVPTEDAGEELDLLCSALDILPGSAFLFAVCEQGPLRERLIQHVREHLSAAGDRDPPAIEVELSPEHPDLVATLLPHSEDWKKRKGRPPAVLVRTRKLADATTDHGDTARMEQARRALRALNIQRERLSRLGAPLVFWLDQNALGQVMHHAADVFAARGGLFFFQTPKRAPDAPSPMRPEATVKLLDRFHRTMLPPDELRGRASLYQQRLERERAADAPNWPRIASLCRDLARIYRELDDHERRVEFLHAAIEAYQQALAEWKRTKGKEQEWAGLQFQLGSAYYSLMPMGNRAEYLARAIECFQQALTVYTPQTAPFDYAATQNNLGEAYRNMPTGDRAENLERAIECFQQTLTIHTSETAPFDYARTQNNIGEAYRNLPTGDRAENLARAIKCFQQALTIYTPEAAPFEYAMTQNNLGNAYLYLPTGDRAENLARAIECYQQVLTIYTPETAPFEYAKTQNNLGRTYTDLPTGDRAENLERAIECLNDALAVWTAEAVPRYHDVAAGNLERALAARRSLRSST